MRSAGGHGDLRDSRARARGLRRLRRAAVVGQEVLHDHVSGLQGLREPRAGAQVDREVRERVGREVGGARDGVHRREGRRRRGEEEYGGV